ncbi:MAG: STAS domain-containing protein [Planctomycetota bacterium]
MYGFSINREAIGDGVDLVKVSGALDAHTFEGFEETLNNLFMEGHFKLIVDMTAVNYISSAGVGVLIGATNEADANGGKLVLLSPTRDVQEVFDALGLTEIFTTAAERQQALAVF